MTDEIRRRTLNYIAYVLDHLKVSPSKLASMAGLASTTLTRPLAKPDHPFTLSTSTLEKIKEASGIEFAPFMTRDMDTLARSIDTLTNAHEYHVSEQAGDDSVRDQMTVVLGEVAAGVWREEQFGNSDSLYGVFVVFGDAKLRRASIGLIVRGESLNKLARDGDVLICESIAETGNEPRENDLVIVERMRGDLIEITAKRLRRKKDRHELWPESDDERFQQPMSIGHVDGETVKVIGIVHYIVRQP